MAGVPSHATIAKKVACSQVQIVGYLAVEDETYPIG